MYLKVEDLKKGMTIRLDRMLTAENKYGQIRGYATILKIYPSYILLEDAKGIRECLLKSDIHDRSCKVRCI